MHFIPEINNAKGIREYQYRDIFTFDETYSQYYLSHCNILENIPRFIFGNHIKRDQDFEAYFNRFEKLGVIYIARQRAPHIIRNSLLSENIGTYGGAITIANPISSDS